MVQYGYDALNRLTSVHDWLGGTTTYTYNAGGRLTGTVNPNATTAAYSYDATGRMTGLANAKGTGANISSYSYTLDVLGNHTQAILEEPLLPVIPRQNIAYTYDDENRLTDTGGTANAFDANGNMTAKGSDAFTYDYNDRLIQSDIGGVITQYSYDGVGNRLMKVEGGVTKRYIQDISGRLNNVLAETDGSGSITAYYVYGLGLISKVLPDDGTAYYYHYDSRGSTIALTDASQNITDAYSYDPFGNVASRTGSTANPFRYVGRYGVRDEGNGLQYIRARYYMPELGRFITKDPLIGKDGDNQSLNRYVYVLNNPVIFVDVSGFSRIEGGVAEGSYDTSGLNIGFVTYVEKVLEGFKLTGSLATSVLKILEKIDQRNYGTKALGVAGTAVSVYETHQETKALVSGGQLSQEYAQEREVAVNMLDFAIKNNPITWFAKWFTGGAIEKNTKKILDKTVFNRAQEVCLAAGEAANCLESSP